MVPVDAEKHDEYDSANDETPTTPEDGDTEMKITESENTTSETNFFASDIIILVDAELNTASDGSDDEASGAEKTVPKAPNPDVCVYVKCIEIEVN
jgi:hypothetical protein